MRIPFLFVFLALTTHGYTQGVKTLNNYVDYANQSADEMTSVFKSIADYYPKLFLKSSWDKRYICPVQLDEFYYKKALQATPVSPTLLNTLKELHNAAEEIDRKCKQLDTYHKLEDYKTDNYAGAEKLIEALQPLFLKYFEKQGILAGQLGQEFKKLNISHSYSGTVAAMMKELEREREFLGKWKFNIREEVHTGWIVDELQKSIAETDAAAKKLKEQKPVLKYPASSMWPSFQEALASILDVKRRALDEYNFEARKSDKHKNDVYLSLINYYNGVLLSDYNTFLNFSDRDNYHGLKAIKFVPVFTIDKSVKEVQVAVTPFRDIPRTRPSPTKQSSAITKPAYQALVNYVDLINETWRQVSHHRDVIRNLNSSASYYASLTSYAGKGGLNFQHNIFEVPLSHFQKAVAESKVLAPGHAESLNAGAEVLINILKEMDAIGALLEKEVSEKKYQQDKVRHIYELLQRTHVLFATWDERKETLFEDIQRIYDAYPSPPSSSWNVSGKVLRELTALDHEGLFRARDYYRGKGNGPVETGRIDEKLREVIANEYDNMKGIEKYGRSHGLCPYTPYEDLPKNSKTLSEYLQALKPAKDNADSYQHPYHSMVYVYNTVVDNYNKFCELSPVLHLPYIKQPEMFILVPPKDAQPETPSDVAQRPRETTAPTQPVAVQTSTPVQQPRTQQQPKAQPQVKAEVKVVRDTVFIEKRDTVWLHDPSENLRSMEGYATNNMVLLLDVSGSMNAPEKLPLLRKSVLDMISMMRSEDRISIVIFSGKPKVLLNSTSFKDEATIRKVINSLKPSGKTDGNAGLKLAYKVADESYIRGGNNRILLATDGEFPVSSDSESLISKFSGEDIFLTVFNFGNRSMNAKNLQKLSTMGKGNYEFISKDNVDIKLIREAKAKRSK